MIQLSDEQLHNLGKEALIIIVSSLQDQLHSLQSQLDHANAQLSDTNRQIELLTEQIGADKVEYKLFHNYKHAADQLYSDENLGTLKEYLDTKLAK